MGANTKESYMSSFFKRLVTPSTFALFTASFTWPIAATQSGLFNKTP